MPSKERLEELIRAALDGQLPPPPLDSRLPDDKMATPKLLALDCKDWVALSRVHYGRSDDPAAVAALKSFREAIRDRRLIIPIHFINAIEAAQCEAPDRRERLVRFMVELSGNWFFRPFFEIAEAETRSAVARLHPASEHPVPMRRSQVIGYGVRGMFGPQSASMEIVAAQFEEVGMREMLERWFSSPEASVELLVEALRGDCVAARALEDKGARKLQAARDADRQLSSGERVRLELKNQWEGAPGVRVRRALAELSLDENEFLR